MFNVEKYSKINDFLKKTNKKAKIIAISKNHPIEKVLEAVNSGVRIFGENKVFEARDKFINIKKQFKGIELHLTGPLQSNKVKIASTLFDVFHTLDREKIAIEFSKYEFHIKNKKIFIQVNTGLEETKSGINQKHLPEFLGFCKKEMGLNIVGLMCIPPINEDPKIHFNILQKLANDNSLTELSIGMSNDYLDALEFNPSYIRLGTILFGDRS